MSSICVTVLSKVYCKERVCVSVRERERGTEREKEKYGKYYMTFLIITSTNVCKYLHNLYLYLHVCILIKV